MGAYTRLEAINRMLTGSSEHFVNSLDSESGVDTSVAQQILDQNIKYALTQGLVNNRFYKKFTPSKSTDPAKTNKIFLPIDTMSAELVEDVLNVEGNGYVIASVRSNPLRLWNVTDQTDIWEADREYIVDITVSLNWEDIDTGMQNAIIASSAREYQMITNGDDKLDNFLTQREVVYQAKGKARDVKKKKRNIFYNNADAMEIIDRKGPLWGVNLRSWRFR